MLLTFSTRVMPPPPSSRVHASWWKGVPSISLIAAQIEFWASRITFSKRARMLQGGSGGGEGGGEGVTGRGDMYRGQAWVNAGWQRNEWAVV
jgi:hypothetical protein